MKRYLSSLGVVLALFAPLVLGAEATKKATDATTIGEQIKWQVIGGGGTAASSIGYKLNGTVVQTATGLVISGSYKTNQGYWYGGIYGYVCGDANGDAAVNISDAVYLIAYIFSGGPAPNPLLSGDANCDSSVNISDAVYLIAYIFSGGPAPCASC
jgi:hypothetical protein